MSERLTAPSAVFINAHLYPPNNGSRVLGLTRGSKLVEMIWTKDSINSCDAYAAYPKIPEDVRKIQSDRFTPEEFKGETK